MKEQDKTPEKQLNEVETGNLPEKEFRIMIVKMIQDLGKRMEAKIEKMQKMFNKDLKGDIDSNTIIVTDFNMPLTSMDRSSRQKVNKKTSALNEILEQMG